VGALSPAVWLRARAKSYARDAELLRSNGDTDDAVVFEAIRDELRKCADQCPPVMGSMRWTAP
jgi:hypothetical protein